MANPFDDRDATFSVLVNAEEQHSLWPVSVDPPAGWTVAFGPAGRGACLEYVTGSWTDMRPLSLQRWQPSELTNEGKVLSC